MGCIVAKETVPAPVGNVTAVSPPDDRSTINTNSSTTLQSSNTARITSSTKSTVWDPADFWVEDQLGEDPSHKTLFPAFTKVYDKAVGSQEPSITSSHILRTMYNDKPEAWMRYHYKSVVNLFQKYREYSVVNGAPDDSTRFHAGGFVPLSEDLSIDLTTDNLSLFVLCHQFKCKASWEVSLEEWVMGMGAANCYSITTLREYVIRWLNVLTSPTTTPTTSEPFKAFYRFVFFYNREANARYVDTAVAVPIWKPLLTGRWDDAELWCKYLTEPSNVRYRTISPDQWLQLLEFVISLHGRSAVVVQHDAMQAWPCVIDDYVEWARGVGRDAAAGGGTAAM
jgi:hypothetical protein